MKNHYRKKELNKSPYNYKNNEDSNINFLDNNEMLDNLIKISGNQEVYKELKDETNKIKKLLSQSKEKLSNINLFEQQNSDIDIYQWNNLFNQSIPITSYVTSSKLIKKKNNKKEENKNEIEKRDSSKIIKHPITLVDLSEEEIKKYLPPNPIGVPQTSVIRFQQLPFRGDSKDTFYFSNDFNDYYKMDFKEFIKRMPVLKAKKRCISARLSYQMKRSKDKSREEDHKREILKNQMSNKLNNLYIEKQYLSFSKNASYIQPLMSSIHAQIYPGKGEESKKNSKLYIKSDKPLGSEKVRESIDYSVNQRYYHRKELNKIRSNKRRTKSTMKKLILPRYDINDPDMAIFKRVELLEKIISDGDNNFNGNQFLDKSIINCEGESKKGEEEKENTNINIIDNKEILKSEDSSNNEYNQNQKNYKLLKNDLKSTKIRAVSANDINKKDEILNVNNYNNNYHKKFTRAMSANVMRPQENQNEYYIHNIYLSTRNKFISQNPYVKKYNFGQRNKLNDIFEENKKGNTSSQISTYEGINNSLYENQNIPRYGLPFKNNHQIQNKMYLKINKRLKEKQYEKVKQKLEEFSKYIHIDDALLSEDFIKEKNDNINNNNNGNDNNQLKYIDKKKLFNRSLSSNTNSNGRYLQKGKRNKKNLNNIQTPLLFKYNKNNFRALSKKSSNENSKIDFTTSFNTKNEFYLSNNNDKVSLVYFNDIIDNNNQKINEMKPIIKKDGIFSASKYFSRSKPQLLNSHKKYKQKKNFIRIQSGKALGKTRKIKDNDIL